MQDTKRQRRILLIGVMALLAVVDGGLLVRRTLQQRSTRSTEQTAAARNAVTTRAAASAAPRTGRTTRGGSAQMKTIYLAGGCFWGTEKYFSLIPGVHAVTSGYAQGHVANPTYEQVCSGTTGARETVKVEYDPSQVSLDALLFAYFNVIDPTVSNRQGNDVGDQYQAGIYFTDAIDEATVARIVALEKKRFHSFKVETARLISFYPAEAYHQDYLAKNPGGYCHIAPAKFAELKEMLVDPGKYPKPADALIKEKLAPEAYRVTQQAATERPFTNAYWKTDAKGIYVDVVTGEPLFSSEDKFTSSCGWPAFSRAIDDNTVLEQTDRSHGMLRTEVRSRSGNSHLGHVFTHDPESPNGTRYCINSAALRFIPYAQMEEQGYGYLRKVFRK